MSMEFAVAIRADEDALLQLGLHARPAPRVAFARDAELLLGRIPMMEIQRLQASVVPTSFALPAFGRDRHLPDLLASFADRDHEVRSPISIRALLNWHASPTPCVYSHPLYQLSYRGMSIL